MVRENGLVSVITGHHTRDFVKGPSFSDGKGRGWGGELRMENGEFLRQRC